MTYDELQAAIISDTHRPDLASEVPRFIRLGEGLIRRELKAYELTETFTGPGGLFIFTGDVSEIRTVRIDGRHGDGLQRVSPDSVKRLNDSAEPLQYAQYGDNHIEIQGPLGDGAAATVRYFGMPAPLSDANPTNTLLTDHEGLYQSAAQYYLYQHTQDRELATDQANLFSAIMDRINEYMTRKTGGLTVAPTYNFTTRSAY